MFVETPTRRKLVKLRRYYISAHFGRLLKCIDGLQVLCENNVDVVNFRRADTRKRHSRIYKCRQHEVIWTNSLIYICPMLKFPASVGELLSGLSQLHTTRRQWCYQPAEIYQHSFSTSTKSRIRFRPFTWAMVNSWNRAYWTNWTNNPLEIKGGKGG